MMSLNKLKQCLKIATPFMFNLIEHTLSFRQYYVVKHDKFLLGIPKADALPVMLVAHIDTVHKDPPPLIFHDQEKNVLWSPHGLGADDRAGVYALLALSKQHRPYLLFTDEEETGGGGAQQFLDIYDKPIEGIKMILQLDRRGFNDCVFYDNDSIPFQKYIESFGFKSDYGTFSDISYLCPWWQLNGANLSVGYYNEHTNHEHLAYNQLNETIKKVSNILSAEIPQYEYEEYVSAYGSYGSYLNVATNYPSGRCCDMCGHKSYDLVLLRDGFHLCEECYHGSVFECLECSKVVYYDSCDNTAAEDNGYCDDCWRRVLTGELIDVEGEEQVSLYPNLRGES